MPEPLDEPMATESNEDMQSSQSEDGAGADGNVSFVMDGDFTGEWKNHGSLETFVTSNVLMASVYLDGKDKPQNVLTLAIRNTEPGTTIDLGKEMYGINIMMTDYNLNPKSGTLTVTDSDADWVIGTVNGATLSGKSYSDPKGGEKSVTLNDFSFKIKKK
ncbi:MAG: hypothetical protein Kapaf2KO_13440 [Candidatus Kapaibacteriales bacterium]